MAGARTTAAVPVPLRETLVGVPTASWVIDRLADFVPADVGAKVTVTSWLCPALIANDVAETENSAALAPERVMLLTLNAASPVLETVKVCEVVDPISVLPRSRLATTEIVGAITTAKVPVPLRETLVGVPTAS